MQIQNGIELSKPKKIVNRINSGSVKLNRFWKLLVIPSFNFKLHLM